MLIPSDIDKIVQGIAVRLQPQKIIVFGSYAKGTATAKSDLDILVIQETEMPMSIRGVDLTSMLSQLLVGVDVHVYTPEEVQEYAKEEFSFISNILSTGKVVFESKEVSSASNL